MGFVSWRGSFAPSTVKKFLKSLACAGVFCIAGAVPGAAGPISFVLYSTTSSGGGSYPNSLLTVDPASGTQHLVAQPGQAADLAWLTVNPVNNTLYGTGFGQSALYTINPNSGAISSKVTPSQNVSVIAASPQGTLYGLSKNTLGTINTATGQFSPVGKLSLSSGYFLGAMAFSPGGTLYGVIGGFSQNLITLDPATGATVSDLGSLQGDFAVGDITYAADGNIYATNASYALLKIDPQTLATTNIGFGDIGALDGIAAISSVPEPGPLSLIGIASMGLLIRLRNRTFSRATHLPFVEMDSATGRPAPDRARRLANRYKILPSH